MARQVLYSEYIYGEASIQHRTYLWRSICPTLNISKERQENISMGMQVSKTYLWQARWPTQNIAMARQVLYSDCIYGESDIPHRTHLRRSRCTQRTYLWWGRVAYTCNTSVTSTQSSNFCLDSAANSEQRTWQKTYYHVFPLLDRLERLADRPPSGHLRKFCRNSILYLDLLADTTRTILHNCYSVTYTSTQNH